MVCIYCNETTQVYNSRLQKRTNSVWRRRKCNSCGAAFSTLEIAQYENIWMVQGVDGILAPFSRDKLLLSLYASCRHRQTAINDATALTETVMGGILADKTGGSIQSRHLKQVIQVVLNRFDKVASTHYAAFHKTTT
jgi:transcriptional repressor NrdR